MGLFFGTPKTSSAGPSKFLLLALALLVGLLTPAPANAIGVIPRDIGIKSTPSISGVFGAAVVRANEWVEITGLGFDAVTEVFVDATKTQHFMQSASRISVLVPAGVNPGDAVLTLRGEFGSIRRHNLFEVSAGTPETQSKITIGTFQGYAAVYTKNFKGHALSILVANKERQIDLLEADFTQNLTFIGAGKTVIVMVYLDRKLVRVQQLQVR